MQRFLPATALALLLGLNSLPAAAKAAAENWAYLQPDREQVIASLNVVELLKRHHYNKPPLDDARSAKIYEGYLKMLDPARSYFTAAEKRPRMEEMVRISTGVETTVCRTPLEAEVLELRLIAAHAPRYNRRSKFPERQQWIKLTREPFPRLSVVRTVADDGACYFGPLSRRSAAEDAMLALYDAFPIRQCTTRLSERTPSGRCALGDQRAQDARSCPLGARSKPSSTA